jgi:hypothetical protein
VHGRYAKQDASRGALPAPPASLSHADVTRLLASQPAPDMPEHLATRVSEAIAAEAARRPDSSHSGTGSSAGADGHRPAGASVPKLPWPRSGKPWPRFELLVPHQREARSAA